MPVSSLYINYQFRLIQNIKYLLAKEEEEYLPGNNKYYDMNLKYDVENIIKKIKKEEISDIKDLQNKKKADFDQLDAFVNESKIIICDTSYNMVNNDSYGYLIKYEYLLPFNQSVQIKK